MAAYPLMQYQLAVGQWIQFSTAEDLSREPVARQEIYQPTQRFLVISREDAFEDPCCCFLVDIAGKVSSYTPRINQLGLNRLVWRGEIRVVSCASVEGIHGADKVASVYRVGEKHIEKLAGYFRKYGGRTLTSAHFLRRHSPDYRI